MYIDVCRWVNNSEVDIKQVIHEIIFTVNSQIVHIQVSPTFFLGCCNDLDRAVGKILEPFFVYCEEVSERKKKKRPKTTAKPLL